MTVEFGTSGLRGLVSEMTPAVIARHIRAFLAACETGGLLLVGRDLRASSPRMAQDVIDAAGAQGCRVIDCGALPTPALALEAARLNCGAVMVTGSHIPADRNGLKFYARAGEITKSDESAIFGYLEAPAPEAGRARPPLEVSQEAQALYVARYTRAFGPETLRGMKLGLYAHSAVGRDMLAKILDALGADVITLGQSADFIPLDTEAVDAPTRGQITDWVLSHGLEALVSTDGDSDRPLLADAAGHLVPGDILGQITAQALGADRVVTPISSNSGVLEKGFDRVIQTRIGSPYVIEAMVQGQAGGQRVVGYEANGGFLLGFAAAGPDGPLAPLLTRDSTLPIIMTLQAGRAAGVAARVAQEPPIVTRADRLQDVDRARATALIETWRSTPAARASFLAALGQREVGCDLTDGVRMTLEQGSVVHVRASGNAPEMRVYVEGHDAGAAEDLLRHALGAVSQKL